MLSVTTKTGDAGKSGLANGERLDKDAAVFEVIGAFDELNSWLGLVVTHLTAAFNNDHDFLLTVQHALFDIGAEIARSPKTKITSQQLTTLEEWSSALQSTMNDHWHTQFLLPGGTETAAVIDIARTVCRRAERRLVAYSKREAVSPLVLKYVNRLSDYLYVLRCHVNAAAQIKEKKYTPAS